MISSSALLRDESPLLPTTRLYSPGSSKPKHDHDSSTTSDSSDSDADDDNDEKPTVVVASSFSVLTAVEWGIGLLLIVLVVVAVYLHIKSSPSSSSSTSSTSSSAFSTIPTSSPISAPQSTEPSSPTPPPGTTTAFETKPVTTSTIISNPSSTSSNSDPFTSATPSATEVVAGSYSPVSPISGGPTGWTGTTVNIVTPTNVGWNTAVTSASAVPGFQGVQGPGIGSWFHTDSTEDSTNGHSWCYFPYFDDNPGFAPDINVMTNNGALTVEEAGPLYCGLEAIVTAPNGNQMTMYILDAFDHTWVKDSGAIDIIYDSFTLLHGSSPGTDKNNVMMGVTWQLTGNRLVAGTFNKGGLGSKRRSRRNQGLHRFANSTSGMEFG